MKGTGLMIKPMDLEFIHIWMEPDTKDIGKKINNMAKAKKHGLMVLFMRESIRMEKSIIRECLGGQMEQSIMENSMIIIFTAKVAISGQMEESTMVIGDTTRCMEAESSGGQMEEGMRESMWMTRRQDKEHLSGQMGENILGCG